MMSFFNIKTVAHFESKTLFRSWFFRIFAIIILGFILMFNLFGITSVADGGWPGRLLPSGAPYFNMWLLNIAQAIIAVFLSAEFLGRDKKLDTTEAFYVRSMSNFDYVIGKTIGVLKVFLLLNILVLTSALVFTLIANEVTIPWISYVVYPLIMSLPTLVFVLGLSFFTMTLVRNQAITFVLLLGFIALSLFYLQNKHLGLFDMLGFYTPFMRSDFTGFQDAWTLLQHRAVYFLLGIVFILATVWRLPRLEQQRLNKPFLSVSMLIMGGAVAFFLLQIINRASKASDMQKHIVELNDKLKPSSYQIQSSELEIWHKNETIECVVSLKISTQQTEQSNLSLVLNPGLIVTSCAVNNQQIKHKRDAHLINITMPKGLEGPFNIELKYAGTVLDDAMYPDITAEARLSENRKDPLLAGKQYSFIQDNYLLLTREAAWYPVIAEKQYWVSYPFTPMTLTVNAKPDLTIITQGRKDSIDIGTYRFTPDNALNAYGLIIGDYERHTTMVDSIEFNLYHHKTHTFYKEYFTEINDTVPEVVKSIKDDLERKLGVHYPFKRFSVVETPINFYSYLRNWSLATENIMPEMVLFPENGGGTWQNDLQNVRSRIDNRMDRSNEERSEKELQVELLNSYLGDNFISPSRFFFGRRQEGERNVENWGRYQVFPLYFSYANRIEEKAYPLLTIALENYLHNRMSTQSRRRDLGGLSNNDEVILKLRDNSLKELIDKEDVNTLGNVFASKGHQLFSNLKVFVGQTDFDKLLDELIKMSQFQNRLVDDFNADVSAIIRSDFAGIYNNWLNEAFTPAFQFSSIDAFEIKDGNRIRYFLKLTVANSGNADGIIAFTIREGRQRDGRGRFRSRFQMAEEQDNQQSFQLQAGQTYDLGFLLDEEPRDISVNTFLAANIPSSQTLNINDVVRNSKINYFEGIRESKRKLNFTNSKELIVDNEDEGFSIVNTGESRTVKDWWVSMQNENEEDDTYGMVRFWNPPVQWKPVVGDKFFGDYLKSAVYKRKGSGDGYVNWKGNLKKSGMYEVHAHVPYIRMRRRRGGGSQETTYNFTVYHDDGEEEVKVKVSDDNDGWLYLGEFYFSEGVTNVRLSDVSNGEYVIGDAVKWLKK